MVDMKMAKDYAELTLEKRRLEAEANELSKQCAELEEQLLEQFSEDGVQNLKLDGIGTLYISSKLWAGAAKVEDEQGNEISDKQVTCDALKAAGLGVFVSEGFNVQTLSAWLREQPTDELGDPILPEELVGKMSVTRRFNLGVRKAASK